MRLYKLSLLAATFTLLLSSAAYAKELDVVGIKLGMTHPQVLEAIKKHNPQCKVTSQPIQLEALPKEPMTFVLQCSTPDFARIEVALSGAPAPSKALTIIRNVRAPQNQPVAVSNLLQSLREKYGKESFLNINHRKAIWFLDKSGNAVGVPRIAGWPEAYVIDQCGPKIVGNPHHYEKTKDLYKPDCGTVVTASWQADWQNKDLATEYQVGIGDHPVAVKSQQELVKYLANAESAHQAQKNKKAAKQAKPQL